MTVLADRLTAALDGLRSSDRITPTQLEGALSRIRLALLDADVALPATRAIVAAVAARAQKARLHKALDAAQTVTKIVHEELTGALGGTTTDLALRTDGPTVIALVGLQGAGKTSFSAKLAARFIADGHRPLLVAADLARPGAVAQLTRVGAQSGASVYAPQPGNGAGDPVAVVAGARAAAAAGGYDVIIVDTAGRITVDADLMTELVTVVDVVAADQVLLVVDALSGQDVAATAAGFAGALTVSGVVLTKTDGDARGGAALTLAHLVGAPIMYTATGEHIGDLEVFHPDRQAGRILGMGDVLTLIENAERSFAAEESAKMVAAAGSGELSFDDFAAQLRAVARLGSLTKLVGMLPGAQDLAGAVASVSESDIARVQAMIGAMTPGERAHPELIDASRASRIAAGSGTTPEGVRALVDQLFASRDMMRQATAGRSVRGLGHLGDRTNPTKRRRRGKRR